MKFWGTRIGSVLIVIAIAFAIDAGAKGMLSDFGARLVVLAGLYVTLAVSLNLINGITGQFSIGHAAFYQVGAYAAGFVSVRYFAGQPLSIEVWLPLMMVLGGLVAGLAGFVVGLPSLRLRGDYLAIVTLGFGEIIRIVTQNLKPLGAASGMPVQPKTDAIWLAWLLAFVSIAVCRNLLRTAHGLPFLAVREDEVASSAMGVNVTRVKVTAFVLGSAFAGAAGAYLAHFEGFLIPTMFTMELSFIVLTMVVLGGTGSITGSAFAAIMLSALPELLRDVRQVSMPGLLAATVAIIAAVALLRRMGQTYHGDFRGKCLRVAGILAGCVGGLYVLRQGLFFIPALASASADGSRLRLVIFAAVLIILMLLRPQGIFGHREFSWSWFRRKQGASA
jgi:branched-chain amino acid transport system permease protein